LLTTSQGGTIKGSINLPAQSLYPTIPSLYALFSAAGVRQVIWYCGMSSPSPSKGCVQHALTRTYSSRIRTPNEFCADFTPVGSSRGRGNRAAAWFADYIKEESDDSMQSLVLEGGIKGWVAEKGEYVEYMQDYEESSW